MAWDLYLTDEVDQWLEDLASSERESVGRCRHEVLAEIGPNLGRPLVDRIKGVSAAQHEGTAAWVSRAEVRVLFTFDPWRLSPATRPGNRTNWYRRAAPRAEELYEEYLRERSAEEGAPGWR